MYFGGRSSQNFAVGIKLHHNALSKAVVLALKSGLGEEWEHATWCLQ